MVFKMRTFKEIDDIIVYRVDHLCGLPHHKVLTYEQLVEHRRQPIQFLYTVIDELKKSELADNDLEQSAEEKKLFAENRALVLSGIALITVAMIDSPGSYLSQWLQVAVGISDENKLDPNTGEDMLCEAMNFLETRVFTNGNSRLPLLEDHVFYNKNKGFNFDAYFNKGVDMLANFTKEKYSEAKARQEAEIKARQEAELKAAREQKEAERLAKSKDAPSFLSSYLPSSIWSAAPKKVDTTDNDKKEEKEDSLVSSPA